MKIAKRCLLTAIIIALSAPFCSGAQLDKVPEFEKDILLIVPFNPGAVSDAYAQMIKQIGEKYIDHFILLEYKPGGNTSVGINFMLTKPHDGYTISIPGNNPEYTVATGQTDTYDEFSYVSIGSPVSEQSVLIVPPGSPFKSLQDVLEFAAQHPGQLNWGGANTLGFNHFFALETMKNGNVEFNYVPYDNAGEVVLAVLGKNVDVGTVTFSTALPYYNSGEVRAIAQSLPERDMESLADVPTIYETPGLEYERYGIPFVAARPLIAHAATPEAMLEAWDRLMEKIVSDPAWIAWVEKRNVIKNSHIKGADATKLMRNNTDRIRKIYETMAAPQ